MEHLGFIGLGIMGSAMARNLLRAGYRVSVWNRSQQRCGPLVAEGATALPSPRAVAEQCDVTLAILSDPQAARQVALAEDGVTAGIGAGRGYVDCSTVDPDTVREIASAIAARGGRFLEAPVSGSKKPAEDGSLVLLTAGDRELYEQMGPAFEVLGKLHVFLGAAGNGAALKLIVNMVMGEMVVALGEGLSLARHTGLSTDTLLQVLDAGAMANPLFRLKGPKMEAAEFEVNFPLKHMQKDLRLAVALGDRLAQPLPGAAAANELFKRARAQGLEDQDFSAVFLALATAAAP